MSWMSHPVTVSLRNRLRRSGLTKLISQAVRVPGYENAFRTAMEEAIQRGDQVWDIGANVGYYTLLFCELAGENGHVTALEPGPEAFRKLKAATASLKNSTVICKAIGEEIGIVNFVESGPISHIVEQGSTSTIAVPLITGDQLIASGEAPVPQVIKVDIEGFELEAVRGMAQTLSRPSLRFIGIEIHFGALNERGLADAPAEIEQCLKDAGMRTKWIGSSHLTGERI